MSDVSPIEIIDVVIDDVRSFFVVLSTILLARVFSGVANTDIWVYKVVSWAVIIVTGVDIILFIMDFLSGFFENLWGSIGTLVINAIILIGSALLTMRLLKQTSIKMELLYQIMLGATIFNVMSLIWSTITNVFNFGDLVECIRLLLMVVVILAYSHSIFSIKGNTLISEILDLVYEIAPWLAGGVLLVDLVLCIVDFFMGVYKGIDAGDIFSWVVNVVIYLSLIAGCIFAESLLSGLFGISRSLTFVDKLGVAFAVYCVVDLLLAVPINLFSNIYEIVEENY